MGFFRYGGIMSDQISSKDVAVRAHDIAVCLERTTVPEFELLHNLGMATRLALHLRGVQAVRYEIVKMVATFILDFPTSAVKPVLEILAEAEFVQLVTEGKTIKTVIPDVPYYDRLFEGLGSVVSPNNFSEHEKLTVTLAHRLASSPLVKETVYNYGAEKRTVDRIVDIGIQSAFLSQKRARGKNILISPTYFAENTNAYADLVASEGSGRVKKIINLLKSNQGWPLSLILSSDELGGVKLDKKDLIVFQKLAGYGFLPPPAIETKHAGVNHFLFGPRPGKARLPLFKKPIYEAAMALVAAVRQGQLLPNKFAIRSPFWILNALKDKGFIKANTEAYEQYKKVATLRVGRLVKTGGDWYRFELIRNPENEEAVEMAILMVSGGEAKVESSEDIILALRKGEKYVESLIGRKRLLKDSIIDADEETENAIDEFLLRGK